MSTENESDENGEVENLRTSDFVPCVRYARDKPETNDIGQSSVLRPVGAKIPNGASYTSPVYLLTDGQYERLRGNETGRVGSDMIATVLQNECGDSKKGGEVLYPVYIESDALEDDEAEETPFESETLFEWYRELLSELGVDHREAKYYFSGNRSIHVHVPRFVVGEEGRKALGERAGEFNGRNGVDLDESIYDQNSQFRLPGAIHQKTDMPKTVVEFGDTRKEMISKTLGVENPSTPETGIDLLRQAFGDEIGQADASHNPEVEGVESEVEEAVSLLGGEDAVLTVEVSEEMETPLVERDERPEGDEDENEWKRYNRHPFSPYANAEGGERSVAVVTVKGKPFCRKSQSGINRGAFIPAHFWGSLGCDDVFTIPSDAPLRLSDRDYEKWSEREYQEGDVIAIIGGMSRSSIIIDVGKGDGIAAGSRLNAGGKEDALAYLEEKGYDIGSAGSEYEDKTKKKATDDKKSMKEAESLQRGVEQGQSIQSLSHNEKLKIADRLLQIYGWNEAFEWFRDAFGSDFDEDITHTQLKGLVNKYDDLSHIEVP